MKKAATIRPMGTCLGILAASVIGACGGGNGASSPTVNAMSVGAASALSVTGATDSAQATPVLVAASANLSPTGAPTSMSTAQLATAPTDTRPVAVQVAEAKATLKDGAALALEPAVATQTSPVAILIPSQVGVSVPVALTTQVALSTQSAALGSTTANPPSTGYTKVADENGTFNVGTAQTVRFGAPSQNLWVTKTVSGSGACTNSFFGRDPAYGIVKVCQVLAASGSAGAPVAAAAMATATAASPPLLASNLAPVIDLAKIPAPTLGFSDLRVSNTTEVAPAGDGAFRTVCTFAHMSFDDPIVFPGQAGRSHLHTFFGNTGSNANSTADSLRTTGNSTCRGGIANRSAYWVPTMIDTADGTPIVPDSIGVYYKNGEFDGSLIKPIPVGLRMIAGDPTLTVPDSPVFARRFKCVGGPNNENDKYGPGIPNCDVGAQVWSEVFFPQCWDGVNLDSPDHKSHMSYLVQDMSPPFAKHCPATHPVIIPQITFNVIYTVTTKDAPLRWRLASDRYDPSLPGGYSSHGDWFNGWKSDISDAWAKSCVQAKKDCHSHLLGDGRMIY